jgi:hypothetical protein
MVTLESSPPQGLNLRGGTESVARPEGVTTPSPAASVIVTAHDRRQYLRAAVESVLTQDLDRSTYELIVVKNFADDGIDLFLDRAGARRLICTEEDACRKVAEGVQVSHGRVLFLLDDDDLFEPGKLRQVLGEFRRHPDLGFYHNQVSFIGSDGTHLDVKRARPFGRRTLGKARRVYLINSADDRDLNRLAHSRPSFNASSLAVRRDLALAGVPYLLRLEGARDLLFLYLALVSGCALLFDDAQLTRYRVHGDNISLAAGGTPESRREHLMRWATRGRREIQVIREMVLESGNTSVLRQLDGVGVINQLSIVFLSPESRRGDAIAALSQGLRLQRTYAIRENLPSITAAVVFAASPRLARAVYDRQRSIR